MSTPGEGRAGIPVMTLPEAMATTRIHSVAGLTGNRTALVTTRLLRAPHHTISDAGLIGGGHVPLPGSQPWILPLTCHHGSAAAEVPPQAWRVPSAAPRDEAAPPQAGLHPGVAPLDPLCLPQPFMTVPHVDIEGLLSRAPHA